MAKCKSMLRRAASFLLIVICTLVALLVTVGPALRAEDGQKEWVVDQGLMWTRPDKGKRESDPDVALHYSRISYHSAESLCRDIRLGGYDNWRIPTFVELLRLYNEKTPQPCGKNNEATCYLPKPLRLTWWDVWSSTRVKDPAGSNPYPYHKTLRFSNGSSMPTRLDMEASVLCVRDVSR